MKSVSMDELKKDLAGYVREANEGEPVLITRHGQPVAKLTGLRPESLHVGSRSDRAHLRPAVHAGLNGLSLEYLEEDRRDREERLDDE